MKSNRTIMIGLLMVATTLSPALATAEVTRVEITTRRDVLGGRTFGSSGPYEHIVGRLHFAVDPTDPRNRVIVDLDKAPKNAAGHVEFSADLEILRPREPGRGNGIALIDVVNRGNKVVLRSFNRATGAADPATESAYGDGFLLRQGFTIVGRLEFDVGRVSAVRISVPPLRARRHRARTSFPTRRTGFGRGDFGIRAGGSHVPEKYLERAERRDGSAVGSSQPVASQRQFCRADGGLVQPYFELLRGSQRSVGGSESPPFGTRRVDEVHPGCPFAFHQARHPHRVFAKRTVLRNLRILVHAD